MGTVEHCELGCCEIRNSNVCEIDLDALDLYEIQLEPMNLLGTGRGVDW